MTYQYSWCVPRPIGTFFSRQAVMLKTAKTFRMGMRIPGDSGSCIEHLTQDPGSKILGGPGPSITDRTWKLAASKSFVRKMGIGFKIWSHAKRQPSKTLQKASPKWQPLSTPCILLVPWHAFLPPQTRHDSQKHK